MQTLEEYDRIASTLFGMVLLANGLMLATGRWTWFLALKRRLPLEASYVGQVMRDGAQRNWNESRVCMYGKTLCTVWVEEGCVRAGPLLIVLGVHAKPGPVILAILWLLIQTLWILCHPIEGILTALDHSNRDYRSAVANLAALYRLLAHDVILNGVWWGSYVLLMYHLSCSWWIKMSVATAMSMIVHAWWNTRVAQRSPWFPAIRNWACPWIVDSDQGDRI